MNPSATYNQILKVLRKQHGNGITTNITLDALGKRYFCGVYLGTYPWNKYPINKLPEYGFAIINTDDSSGDGVHWVAVHNYKNTIYIYDSFGRKSTNLLKGFSKLIKKYGKKLVDSKYDAEQADSQEDCGMRCLAWLMIVKCMGVKKALAI